MKSLLIYYGWLNSFNSASNSWDNEKVSQEFARYNLLVFGDGIQSSSHGDYSNTSSIIPRIKTLNSDTKIFGYVTVNQSYANFKTKVDEWVTLGVHGIFFDEAGYDYGSTTTNGRDAFNDKVDYCHSKDLLCFVNAWKPEHVLSNLTSDNDASYPNTTWNPDLIKSNLNENDWYLLESFAITSTPSFESKTQWKARGEKVQEFDINIAACSVISDSDSYGDDKFKFIEVSARMFELDAVGSSDVSYGASSAKSKMWARPTIDESVCWGNPMVDNNDSDLYLSYSSKGILKIDFSSGSETASFVDYH